MSEWLKIILGAAVTAVGVYITIATDVRDHGHRIDRLEKWSETHADKHEVSLEKIDGRLSRIEIAVGIGRMAGDTDRNPMASSVMSKSGSK